MIETRDLTKTYGDLYAGGSKRPRDIDRARVLVRLNADEGDHAEAPMTAKTGKKRRHIDMGVGLIDCLYVEVDIRPEHLPFRAIGRDAVHVGQRIGRNDRAPPADHISIVVVV